MQNINYFSIKTLKYDLINKFNYKKTKNIPKLKKIILHFNCKNSNIENLASSLLAFKLLTQQKGKLSISKKSNILFKIKKGHPTGCTTSLRNQIMCVFLKKITFKNKVLKIAEIFNTLCNHPNKNSFSIRIKNTFNNFKELKSNFYFFNSLDNLEIVFIIKSKFKYETVFILKSYNIFLTR